MISRTFLPILAVAVLLFIGGCGRKNPDRADAARPLSEPSAPVAAVTTQPEIIADPELERAGIQPRRARWWRKLEE